MVNISVLSIDLAKNVFQLHGIDATRSVGTLNTGDKGRGSAMV